MNRSILEAVHGLERNLFSLLRDLVNIQSGTRNREGVNRVGRRICEALHPSGLSCRIIAGQQGFGDHLLFATPAAGTRSRAILLIGHMDTVFPQDTSFLRYQEKGDRITGPGIIDMKGGLAVMIGAALALARTNRLADLPLRLLFTSDEETGSPTAEPLLAELAPLTACALVMECGGMHGEVVTGRRGKRGYRMEVRGRAGHAAFAGPDKASAILEMAKRIPALESLNDPGRGLVVNVGQVRGGIGPNSVPAQAEAFIDTRYQTREDGVRLAHQIKAIVQRPGPSGITVHLEVTGERPVMEPVPRNKALFDIFRQVARELSIPIREEIRAGVSDANSLAGLGVPVLDGLGPIGEFDHSDREYMLKDSLMARTRLLTLALPLVASHSIRC